MNTLEESALAFIRGSGWTQPLEAARELRNLAKWGCEWPKATITQWEATFDKLVADGQLERRADGCIFIAIDRGLMAVAHLQLGLFSDEPA